MAFFASAGHNLRRHPLRLTAFVATAALAAVVLNVTLTSPASAPVDPPFRVKPYPMPADTGDRANNPWYARRIPLYLVDSEEAAYNLKLGLASASYVELAGGGYGSRWAIQVMSEHITLETIEHLNIARIATGVPPYRVVDTR